MIYVYKDRIINIEWTVLKGTSTVKENFDRALVKLFLIGPHEKFLLKANAKDGIVSAEVPQGLPEGVYAVEIIYIKNWLGIDRPPKMLDRLPVDCRGNDRCIMRSRKDNLFAITEYESEATDIGEGEVVIRVKTSTASYGYDGLSAYEIAVLRGDFEGTEGEWLEWTHKRIVSDVKDLLDKLKSRDTRFVVKTKSQRDSLKDLREGDEVYVIDDGIAYILEMENGKRTWKPCDYGTVTAKYMLSLISGMPGFVADRAIADEFGKRIVDEYLTRDAVRNYMNEVFNDLFINNPPTIMDGMITVDMLSDAVKQLIGFGPIVNFPDDEFLTTKGGRITPKDRNYDPNNYSGMGRKILRKNMVNGVNVLTQKMMSCPNTVYVITYDYSLRGQEITVPENCVLQFEGGSFANGTIEGHDTRIIGDVKLDCILTGTYIGDIDGCWFIHNTEDNTVELQRFFNLLSKKNKGFFSKSISVNISNNINIKSNTNIDFTNCSIYQLSNSAIIANEKRSTTYDDENISISNLHMYNITTNVISLGAIIMRGVKNFKLENFYYTSNVLPPDPRTRNWALTISGIDIYMNNINIDNFITGIWSDGIHFEYIQNLILTNFNIKSGDDCIAINPQDTADKLGGYLPNISTNIIISNGICSSNRGNIIRIGVGGDTVSSGYYAENITIKDITVIGEESNPLISLQDFRTVTPNNPSNNILISNIKGIANSTGKTKTIAIEGTYVPVTDYVWDNITFENLDIITEGTGTRIRIYNALGVSFKDCNINLKGDTEINPYKILSRSTKLLKFKGCNITSTQTIGSIIRLSNSYRIYMEQCSIYNSNQANTSIAIDIADILETAAFTIDADDRLLKIEECVIEGVGTSLRMPTDDVILFNTGQFSNNIRINSPTAISTVLNHFNDLYCSIGDIIPLATTLPAISSVNGLRLGTYTYDLNLHRPKFAGINTDNVISYFDAEGYKYARIKGSTAQRPELTSSDAGFKFYDNVLRNYVFWTGTEWINADGTIPNKVITVTTKSDISEPNVIYKIVRDIDLGNTEKAIPANCTLDFQGGNFSNGTIVGNGTTVLPYGYKIQGIDLKGTFKYLDGVSAISSDDICLNNVYDVLDAKNLAKYIVSDYQLVDSDYSILPQFRNIRSVRLAIGSFAGFPTSVVYNNVLYCFYYQASSHTSTPGVHENLHYKYSSNNGDTWSDEKELVLPASDSSGMFRSYRTAYAIPFNSNILLGVFVTTSDSSEVKSSFTMLLEVSVDSSNNISIVNQIKVPVLNNGSLVNTYLDNAITDSMIIGGNIIKIDSNYLFSCYTSSKANYIFSFDGNFADNTHIATFDIIPYNGMIYTEHTFIKFSDTNFYIAFREDARRENTPIFKYNTSTSKFELFAVIDDVAYDGLDAVLVNDNTAVIMGRDWKNYYTPCRFALMNDSGKVYIDNAKYYGDVLGRDCGYCSLQVIDNKLVILFYIKISAVNYNYNVVETEIDINKIVNLMYY